MTTLSPPLLITLAGLAVGCPRASAQSVLPRVRVVEAEELPGIPGSWVRSIGAPIWRSTGERGVPVALTNAAGELEFVVFGRTDPGASDGVLISSATLPGLPAGTAVRDFEPFADLLGPAVLLGATLDGSAGGEAPWIDAVLGATGPVVREGDPLAAMPGLFLGASLRARFAAPDDPAWLAQLRAADGMPMGVALLRGTPPVPVLSTGDVPAGLARAIATNGIEPSVRFAPDGSHVALRAYLAGDATDDAVVLLDGALATLAGANLREGQTLPPAMGGLGAERFEGFYDAAVDGEGSLFVLAGTNATAARDGLLLGDGGVLLREGDGLPGGDILAGEPRALALGPAGEWTVLWSVQDGAGGERGALVHRGRVLLSVGDGVDLDGDGLADPGATLSAFEALAPLAAGAEGELGLTVRLDLAGTAVEHDDRQAWITVSVPRFLDGGGALLSIGAPAPRSWLTFAPADAPVDLVWILGSTSGTSPGVPTGIGLLPLVSDAYTQFTITTPGQGLVAGALHAPDGLGVGEAELSLPPGVPPSLVGTQLYHAWVGLSVLPTTQVVAVGNAVVVELAP